MGKCISKSYAYNAEVQNQITNVSPFVSDDCLLKEKLGIIMNQMNDKYTKVIIDYLANDRHSIVFSLYDRQLSKKIALRVVEDLSANPSQPKQLKAENSLDPAQDNLILEAFQTQHTKPQLYKKNSQQKSDNCSLYYQELEYESYMKYLKKQCLNGIYNLRTLQSDHHLCKRIQGDFGYVFLNGKSTDSNLNPIQLNRMRPQNTSVLGMQLQKCINLEDLTLDLSYCHIGNIIGEVIKHGIYKQLDIQKLSINLRGNQIEPEGLQNLLIGISKCKKLTHLQLNLSQNYLKEEGVTELGNVVAKSKNLVSLTIYLGKNQTQARGAQTLINKSLQCKKLEKLCLDLTCNQIYFGQEPKIKLDQPKCVNLTHFELDLSDNYEYQDNNNIQELENSLSQLANLRVFRIHFDYDKSRVKKLIKKAKRLVCIN